MFEKNYDDPKHGNRAFHPKPNVANYPTNRIITQKSLITDRIPVNKQKHGNDAIISQTSTNQIQDRPQNAPINFSPFSQPKKFVPQKVFEIGKCSAVV
jgi:hypothetical protein